MKYKTSSLWIFFLSLISLVGFTAYYIFHNSSHIVTFNANGGTKIQDIEVKEKATLNAFPIPSKSGYLFLGWYLEDGTLFDINTPINKNITLNAKWEKALVVTYTVRFDTLSGDEIEDMVVEEGTILDVMPIPIKDTYEFLGWYYHNKEFDFKTPITSDITLVAKYEKLID